MHDGQAAPGTAAYEWRMVLVTSLAISFLAFDRLASGALGPYLIAGLNLSKTQLGSLYSVQAIAVALMGFVIGGYSDHTGNRRKLLALLLTIAALCALAVMTVNSYAGLMLARLASGMALGAVSPISQSILTIQSSPARIGRNIGVQTLLMFMIGQVLGPFLLPVLAERWGWQAGFTASALPFLILAVAVLVLLRESPRAKSSVAASGEGSSAAVLSPDARRTVWLCLGIAAFFMIWLVIYSTFLTVFLVERWGVSPPVAGSMLGTLGIAGGVGGFVLPLLSDRLGRKTILLLGMGLAAISPVAVLFWTGPLWGLQVVLAIGWLAVGVLPLYAVIIPGAVVPQARIAVTIALIIGTGEVVGGVGGPILAGQLADLYGLLAPFWLALLAVVASFGLTILLPRSVQ